MKYKVIDEETGISIEFFSTKKEADKKAKFMTEYHSRKYTVKGI